MDLKFFAEAKWMCRSLEMTVNRDGWHVSVYSNFAKEKNEAKIFVIEAVTSCAGEIISSQSLCFFDQSTELANVAVGYDWLSEKTLERKFNRRVSYSDVF